MTYLALLVRSLFDPESYRYMRQRYVGMGFGYLFFMIALVTLVYVSMGLYHLHDEIFARHDGNLSPAERYLGQVADQIPPMIIEEGEMMTTAETPYMIFIDIGESFEIPFISIMPEAQPDDVLETGIPIIVSRDAIHVSKDGGTGEIRSYYFSEMETDEILELNADLAHDYVANFINWYDENLVSNALIMGLVFFAFFLIIWMIWALIQVLVFGMIMMLIGLIMKTKLSYEEGLKLACLALTPAYLIQMVLSNLMREETFAMVPGVGLPIGFYILVILGYCVFAVYSVKRMPESNSQSA